MKATEEHHPLTELISRPLTSAADCRQWFVDMRNARLDFCYDCEIAGQTDAFTVDQISELEKVIARAAEILGDDFNATWADVSAEGPKVKKPNGPFQNVGQYVYQISQGARGEELTIWAPKMADIGFCEGEAFVVEECDEGFLVLCHTHGARIKEHPQKPANDSRPWPVLKIAQPDADLSKLGSVGSEVVVTLWRHHMPDGQGSNHITITL